MQISIIISTYNRYKTLMMTLESLCKQETDGSFEYEIIVVDNNSNDKTKEIVGSFMTKDPKFKYLFEANQGLSNARNAGIHHATGEILGFTDDDVILDTHWLLNIAQFHLNCDFDAVGGKVLPLYPPHTPEWIKENKDILAGPILCHDNGEIIKIYDRTMLPFVGANMVIKQKILKDIGGFNPNIGPGKGTMGDDTECFSKLKKANKKIFYNPKILIMHPVDSGRMSLKYIGRWNVALGRYRFIIDEQSKIDQSLIYWFGIPRYLIAQMIHHLTRICFSFFNRRDLLIAWINLCLNWGKASETRKVYLKNHAQKPKPTGSFKI